MREAYVDWHPAPETSAQFGRINLRQGVAVGYNPTDYFRAAALRSSTSIDPDAVRSNRLGVVAIGGLQVWDGGAVGAMLVPRLADAPSARPFDPDFGATNAATQLLTTWTQNFTPELKPQFSLLWREKSEPQFGLDVAGAAGQSTVAYLEWSGGRGRSLAAAALATPESLHTIQRITLGLTYTTSHKITLTAEAIRNGAGFDAAGWQALRAAGPTVLGPVLLLARDSLDPPSRWNWFFRVAWKDLLVPHLDLSAFARLSRADTSQQRWLELRYRVSDRAEVYAQYQDNRGVPGTVYGSVGVATVCSAFIKYYFL